MAGLTLDMLPVVVHEAQSVAAAVEQSRAVGKVDGRPVVSQRPSAVYGKRVQRTSNARYDLQSNAVCRICCSDYTGH